jgi:heme-degrading monooxygenase HmoA
LPDPPYYLVVFASLRTDNEEGYAETSSRMLELAAEQPGFLGVDSARGPGGLGITVSYFEDAESVAAWRRHAEHRLAQQSGRRHWYESYAVHVAKVERGYRFDR